jgi:hypothetical protein
VSELRSTESLNDNIPGIEIPSGMEARDGMHEAAD